MENNKYNLIDLKEHLGYSFKNDIIIKLFFNTGLRLNEVANLIATYKETKEKVVNVLISKKRAKVVKIEIDLGVFLDDEELEVLEKTMWSNANALQHYWIKYRTKSKLDNFKLKDFRDYFALTIYENSDYDLFLTSKMLNHSNIAVTDKYLKEKYAKEKVKEQRKVKLI